MAVNKKHTVELTTDELKFLEDRMWFLQMMFGPDRPGQPPRQFAQDEDVYVEATRLRGKLATALSGKK